MIYIDLWHGDTTKDVKKVTCFFNDSACYYWGHLYNSKNEIIGDYNTPDSVELEKMFPGIFGN